MDAARDVYERLVSVFNSSGRFWKQYIEQEVTGRRAATHGLLIVVRVGQMDSL